MTKQVITYTTSRDERINVTPRAEKLLTAAGLWPRGRSGEEYGQVYRGLHWSGEDVVDAEVDVERAREMIRASDTQPARTLWDEIEALIAEERAEAVRDAEAEQGAGA